MKFLPLILLCSISTLLGQGKIAFTDVTEQAGITWRHFNGATHEKFLIETMGGGGAFIDYDNDGWLDIYLVNSGEHANSKEGVPGQNALYRNRRDGTFEDVTEKAGVAGRGYGNGVSVGDFDNNGFPDLFITTFGRDILYRNRGDGTFEDVSSKAGFLAELWSTSSAFFDADNDGDLDLFVCIYLEWSYEKNVWCGDRSAEGRAYCHPEFFNSVPSQFFRNNGDGTFTEAAREANLWRPGKALGVVTADFERDGDIDLHVTNHGLENFLYLNRGNGEFREVGLVASIALGPDGLSELSTGTDVGDFNNDGEPDLFVSNSYQERDRLFLNLDGVSFQDVFSSATETEISWAPTSGFGARFLDLDLDGDQDVVALNGHPRDNVEFYDEEIRARQPPLVLLNEQGVLSPVSDSGAAMQQPYAGRALAAGDYDNDGDPDLLFVNNGEKPALLRNDLESRRWFGLRLIGTASNRSAIGARVSFQTNRRTRLAEITGGGSYQAGHDLRVVFGINENEIFEQLQVRWPNGQIRTLPQLRLGMYHTARE